MPNNFQVFRQDDKESAAAEAGENLNFLLEDNKKSPILLMLSGGSSLSILDYVGQKALGENVTVSLLDDRFSHDPAVNSFLQLQKKDFYAEALEAECSFFGTLPRHEDTMDSLAKRWEKNLRGWRQENPKGLIIGTLGMGADGHASGILPFPESADEFNKLYNSENWTVAYNAGNKNPFKERVATTLTFFRMINIGLAYVSGADKKPKLDEVITGNGKLNELPALIWRQIKDVRVFTDIN